MAYIFKIKLKGSSKPPIWRKIEIDESATFARLHDDIQTAFGWCNSHMYMFSPRPYSDFLWLEEKSISWTEASQSQMEEPFRKAKNWPNEGKYDTFDIKLKDYFPVIGKKIVYIYDFGDDWIHDIEMIEKNDKKLSASRCVGGKGKTPPEDCGGIWGYYNLVETVNNPKDSDDEDMLEWMGLEPGEKWDVHEFDLEEVNKRMG